MRIFILALLPPSVNCIILTFTSANTQLQTSFKRSQEGP
ncbi:hypothetical protein BVRB_7g168520 [Beta vulgaris subsp. vulgaris]|nr:hypothetical protein BVRB_7g168520 [Beta vulgaris subsp. vulgaris]